ncbi:von Hippel-Lindau-like protein [Sinocyclocheilus rhinocerous]|uniref:von Hippel-Lindau disease tumor suppressor n=1 Tax=Sinocyclocheilus rhinocerous TaxID=307959 RepID=A0A673L9V5_9TELE|nr:PREDICTED: von Hippel-Lindau disease tumor suppressor-like [Sinocyclocheilus rhinocerous]
MAEQEAPAPLKSLNSYGPTYISFINKSSRNAEAWWLDFAGKPVSYGDIQPRKSLKMDTFLTHPWIFRASDGAKLLANLNEVYFPTPAQYEEYGYPRYQPVYVTAPVYSLQEYCTRLIRSMVRKEDICKLEIPEGLRKDLNLEPDLLRDIQILSAKRSINGSN